MLRHASKNRCGRHQIDVKTNKGDFVFFCQVLERFVPFIYSEGHVLSRRNYVK